MRRKRTETGEQERAGLYIRVSLDRSAHGLQDEILSPETQESRGRQYCGAQGWQVAQIERDIDESAYRQHYTHREGLMHLLKAVKQGQLTKLVVWKFSRLSRRLKEFIEICDLVEAAGAGLVSVTEQVDTSSPAGRLIRNILASFAQFQSEEISEQIFESWLTKARRGERPPGFAPFGTVNQRGILEPDPATHPHLLAIYRTFRETGSLRAVWDYLTANQVPAPRAAEWSINTIRGILTNPIYAGQIHWAGEVFAAKWEPLIPMPLWEEVQELFAARKTLPAGRREARLLTGLLRCGICGQALWTRYAPRSSGGKRTLERVYWCCSHTTQRRGCDLPIVAAAEAEAAVWQVVTSLLSLAGVKELVLRAAREAAVAARGGQRRQERLLAEEERLREAADLLVELVSEGAITREQFRRQNARYAERLRTVQAQLATGSPKRAAVTDGSLASAVEGALADLPEADRREILAALEVNVVVELRRVTLLLLGLRFNLRARRIGETFRFGACYQRLDCPGTALTDRQTEFIRRTYAWADKRRIAARLRRSYASVVTVARRLRRSGVLHDARKGSQAGSV